MNERTKSINARELLGALFGLQSFFTASKQLFINCRIDNTTAVLYINKKRRHQIMGLLDGCQGNLGFS